MVEKMDKESNPREIAKKTSEGRVAKGWSQIFLGVDSHFFQRPDPFLQGFGCCVFLERRIPGKNGHGSYP